MDRNRCDVLATAIDEAGHGVGRAGDLEVHVVDLLPGERAEVAIDHQSRHRSAAWGHVVQRSGPVSPDRTAPVCPAFGRCGGCSWQHLAYPAQLAAKKARVTEALAGLYHGDLVITASPLLTGYRNKGKYVAARRRGSMILGAYAPRTHEVVDTLGCKTVAAGIDEVAAWVRGGAEAHGLAAFDEAKGTGQLRYVVIRENGDGDVLVVLVVTTSTPRAQLTDTAEAIAKHPAVRGVIAAAHDRRDGAILPREAKMTTLVGRGSLLERVGGVEVDVGAGEFLQVNRGQAQAMYARVAELADASPSVTAVDLYAGLGGITFTLAGRGATVHAIEIDGGAVEQLTAAATRAGLSDRVTASAADAGAVTLPAADVLVVNPPRKGLEAAARRLVGEAAARTLVYVSCGPSSLAADLAALVASGWAIDHVEAFDLMPGTPQVETLVRLRRA